MLFIYFASWYVRVGNWDIIGRRGLPFLCVFKVPYIYPGVLFPIILFNFILSCLAFKVKIS